MAVIPEERKSLRERKIVVPKSEVESFVDKVAKRYQRNATLPGFRKGKAPLNLVKQAFYDRIWQDALREAIRNKLNEEFKDIKLVSDINVRNVDETEEGYEILVEYEVLPEVVIPDLRSIEVEKKIYKVSDVDVANYIEELRRRSAKWQKVEDGEVKEGDRIIATQKEYDSDGKLLDTSKVMIEYDKEKLEEELYEAFSGKRVGDTVEITLDDGSKLAFTIESIERPILPELNDEFAVLSGFQNLEEMKQSIRKQLEEQARNRTEEEYEAKIINKIYEMYPFEPPRTFVYNAYRNLAKDTRIPKNISEEERKKIEEQILANAHYLVIRELILQKIAEQENINVSEDELKEYLKELGETNPERYIKEAKRRGRYDELVYTLKLKKAMDHLKANVNAKIVVE